VLAMPPFAAQLKENGRDPVDTSGALGGRNVPNEVPGASAKSPSAPRAFRNIS